MGHFDVLRLGLILATQAEIEGMKAENMQREAIGASMAFDEASFCNKADELRNLVYCNEDQL